jgi:hypothetical protein
MVLIGDEGLTDYRKVLEEVGYQAVTAAVLQGLKLSRTPWRPGYFGTRISGVIARDASS